MQRRITPIHLKERFYRRRFLVPNAVTLGNMFCGFLTMIYAASGRFDKAVISIGLSILLDGLDGRVARRLKATSKFGVEFDSFSDFLSFGVAPAALIYYWAFRPVADEFGVFICFLFVLCSASRLARFNIQAENLKSFTGLPTPGSAGFVAATVNFFPVPDPSLFEVIICSLVMVAVSALMVSKIEFFSVKQLKVHGAYLFILLGAGIAFIWYNPKVGLFGLAAAYVLSGPVRWLLIRMGVVKPPIPAVIEELKVQGNITG